LAAESPFLAVRSFCRAPALIRKSSKLIPERATIGGDFQIAPNVNVRIRSVK
jgi:hypothetical protein